MFEPKNQCVLSSRGRVLECGRERERERERERWVKRERGGWVREVESVKVL